MKRKLLLFFFVLTFVGNAYAQFPLVKQWDKRFGGSASDFLFSLHETKDGGYILGGNSASNISGDKTQNCWGLWDYWMVKIDSSGNKQWDKDFGGADMDYLNLLQLTTDGGFILGGRSSSGIGGDKTQANWDTINPISPDYWIVKTDSSGNKQWDKVFGGIDDDALTSLQQTNDGGYILGGYSSSGISGDKTQANWDTIVPISYDYWLVKIDSLGNKQWDKRFGGKNYDYLRVVQQTYDGGYIVGGESLSGANGDKSMPSWGSYDYWVLKIDSLGNKQWDSDFGGDDYEGFTSLIQTPDSGYLFGGWSYSGISGDKTEANWGSAGFNRDEWVVKVDSIGNKQWDRDFGAVEEEELYDISITSDGGYLFSGESYSPIGGNKTEDNLGIEQVWILKTDSLGIIQWDKTIFTPGHDENGLTIQKPNGCYIIANCTNGGIGGYKTQTNWDTTNASYDFWIVKFCDTTSTTSIQEITNSNLIEVFPNPFSDKLNITTERNEPVEITLFDVTSRKLLQQTFTNSTTLNTSQLAKGIYLYEVRNKNGPDSYREVKKGKVVKE